MKYDDFYINSILYYNIKRLVKLCNFKENEKDPLSTLNLSSEDNWFKIYTKYIYIYIIYKTFSTKKHCLGKNFKYNYR